MGANKLHRIDRNRIRKRPAEKCCSQIYDRIETRSPDCIANKVIKFNLRPKQFKVKCFNWLRRSSSLHHNSYRSQNGMRPTQVTVHVAICHGVAFTVGCRQKRMRTQVNAHTPTGKNQQLNRAQSIRNCSGFGEQVKIGREMNSRKMRLKNRLMCVVCVACAPPWPSTPVSQCPAKRPFYRSSLNVFFLNWKRKKKISARACIVRHRHSVWTGSERAPDTVVDWYLVLLQATAPSSLSRLRAHYWSPIGNIWYIHIQHSIYTDAAHMCSHMHFIIYMIAFNLENSLLNCCLLLFVSIFYFCCNWNRTSEGSVHTERKSSTKCIGFK